MSDAGVGHNSGLAVDRLRTLVDRIEKLAEERKALGQDIRDVMLEAKSAGFDVKVLREVLRLRSRDKAEREEHALVTETYMSALG